MSFEVSCVCGQRFLAEEYLDGRQVPCPACRAPLRIERPAPLEQLLVACHCGQQFQVPAAWHGREVACPECLQVQQVSLTTAPIYRPASSSPRDLGPLLPRSSEADELVLPSRPIRYDEYRGSAGRSDAEFQRLLRRTLWAASSVCAIAIAFGVIYCVLLPLSRYLTNRADSLASSPDATVVADVPAEEYGPIAPEKTPRSASGDSVERASPDRVRLNSGSRPPGVNVRDSYFGDPARHEGSGAVTAPRRRDSDRRSWRETPGQTPEVLHEELPLQQGLQAWVERGGHRGLRKSGDTDYPIYHYGWLTEVLPFVGQQDLYNRFQFGKPFSEGQNLAAATEIVPQFLNPADERKRWEGIYYRGLALTHFAGMSGVEEGRNQVAAELPRSDPRAGIFGYDEVARTEDISDGTSSTLMVVGSGELAGPWVMGGGSTIRGARQPYFDTHTGLGSRGLRNGSGTLAVMADGSVRFISSDVDEEVFRALCTMHGAESVDVSQHTTSASLKGN